MVPSGGLLRAKMAPAGTQMGSAAFRCALKSRNVAKGQQEKDPPRVINVTQGAPCITVSGRLLSVCGRVGESQTASRMYIVSCVETHSFLRPQGIRKLREARTPLAPSHSLSLGDIPDCPATENTFEQGRRTWS
ncbi:unnamed protein product [Pleuronectes platessa]|uniref:Uncharacterized protein n=1 Tax=Pleuronectes platessa TaxID=8262 RepID=A0A9N7W345_PLEPL|nr:unnamed protein product [Pleuronectes platessa]